MSKQIFNEEELKITEYFEPKQEFDLENSIIEEEAKAVEAELIIEESLKPSRFWVRVLLATLALFGVAVIAQSIQWLIDTFQQKEWIYFAFSIVFFIISLFGVGVIVSEWRKLVYLRNHQKNQQVSQQLLLEQLPQMMANKRSNFVKMLQITSIIYRPLLKPNNVGKASLMKLIMPKRCYIFSAKMYSSRLINKLSR